MVTKRELERRIDSLESESESENEHERYPKSPYADGDLGGEGSLLRH